MFAISAKAAYFFIKEACRRLNGGGKLIAWVSSLLAAYTDGYSTDGASTSASGSCSPSRCWWRSAAPIRR